MEIIIEFANFLDFTVELANFGFYFPVGKSYTREDCCKKLSSLMRDNRISFLKWGGSEKSPRIRFNFSFFKALMVNLSAYLGTDENVDDETLHELSAQLDNHLLGSEYKLSKADVAEFWGLVGALYPENSRGAGGITSAEWVYNLGDVSVVHLIISAKKKLLI